MLPNTILSCLHYQFNVAITNHKAKRSWYVTHLHVTICLFAVQLVLTSRA
jgi:hypothetical protein